MSSVARAVTNNTSSQRAAAAALVAKGGNLSNSTSASSTSICWTPQQRCFRRVMVGLREAYYHDRAKLFWARHRAKVEFYKYSAITDKEAIISLVSIGNEVSDFMKSHMEFSVQRVVEHNETMARLPVEEAKRFRLMYLKTEEEHDSWCKTRIKTMLRRRPPPPYPYY